MTTEEAEHHRGKCNRILVKGKSGSLYETIFMAITSCGQYVKCMNDNLGWQAVQDLELIDVLKD